MDNISRRFRELIEHIIFAKLSPSTVRILWLIIVLLLFVSTAAIIFDVGGQPYNWFPIPVFLACLFFRQRGAYVLIPALGLLLFGLWMRQSDLEDLVLWSAFEFFKWCVTALFTIVTVELAMRYRRHELSLERDIEMARTLQRALIPRNCEIGRTRITGLMRQCRSVGGDFYYFRPFQEKYIVFCLGDIMGKGIPACMIMSIVMSFFFEWGKKSPSPATIMSLLNQRLLQLWGSENVWFTTLFYGVFNEENGVLTYASGGHDTALLQRKGGEIQLLQTEGLPVGAFEESTWVEVPVQLEGGDRVILFTDGLTEARDRKGNFIGFDKVMDIIRLHAHLGAQELIDFLEKTVLEHSQGEVSDDLAILIMEVKEGSVWSPSKNLKAE